MRLKTGIKNIVPNCKIKHQKRQNGNGINVAKINWPKILKKCQMQPKERQMWPRRENKVTLYNMQHKEANELAD